MLAMVMAGPRQPLVARELEAPAPGPNQVRLRVTACGVCRTDLHVLDGELKARRLPLVLGHQVVGVVESLGARAGRFAPGQRVGVPWLAWTCGACEFCRSERENLCDAARFTGYDVDGGYAELAVADEAFCLPIPPDYEDAQAAPLLCGGLIGFRALRLAGEARRVGFYGFGSAAHVLAQLLRWQGREVFAFTRAGDGEAQAFARTLGAVWAGGAADTPPQALDAALVFAPAGELVPLALRAVRKGGAVVCAGIHMSAIPSFPYEILWEERSLRSVANLTRRDGEEFLRLAPRAGIRPEVECYPLAAANEALAALRAGRVRGTAVLQIA
ncbi:MAG TPA: zinc-dependent alcohol dehydrogenase family protein [Vicinamibacteria bacterium]|nr:zinc-dependent alcohol dehydrogenase family protein [Vicinamibacteria bacterium]